MFKKGLILIVAALLITALAVSSFVGSPARAQNPAGDFPLTVELTGVIQAITPNLITLTDGTPIILTPSSIVPTTLQTGQTIIVSAQIESSQLVANIISIIVSTPTPIAITPIPFTPTPIVIVITSPPTAVPPTLAAPAPAVQTATATAACADNAGQPVATRLATAFQVPVDEIMDWHCQGFGFGEIARAYLLVQLSEDEQDTLTVDQIFAWRKSGQGWGNIIKAFGVDPSRLAPGLVIRFRGNSPDDVEFSDSKGKPITVKHGKGKSNKGNKDGKGNGKDNKGNNGNGNKK